MTRSPTGFCFDAAALFGTPSTDPLPAPEPGWVILRIPASLTLQTLRGSLVGKEVIRGQHWYDQQPWSQTAPPAGTYRLRIPVPDSNRKTAEEQDAMLPAGETPAPVVLVAAALLCIRLQGEPDPLQRGWARCAEQTAVGGRVGLIWYDGRLSVSSNYGDGSRLDNVWASSLRTS